MNLWTDAKKNTQTNKPVLALLKYQEQYSTLKKTL